METKAHHVLVGAFTLATIFGIFLFVIWIGNIQLDRDYAYYEVIFDRAVTGLPESGDVRYQGIRVGEVYEIAPVAETPQEVRVVIRIDLDQPIRIHEDASASIDSVGLTGLPFIGIEGGSRETPILPIVSNPNDPLPRIESAPSSLQSLTASVPDVLEQAEEFLRRLNRVASDENIGRLSEMMDNLNTVTGAVAARSQEIEDLLTNSAEMSADLRATAGAFRDLTGELNAMADQLNGLLDGEVRGTLTSFQKTAEAAERILVENETAIDTFADEGLAQVGPLVADARRLVRTLERVALELEQSPREFLLGPANGGEVQTGEAQ